MISHRTHKPTWRRHGFGALIAVGVCAACQPESELPTISGRLERAARRPTPPADDNAQPETGAAPAAAERPAAVVNGRVIARQWLAGSLIETHGLNLLMLRISLEVVQQQAVQADLSITGDDVQAEYDHLLSTVNERLGGGKSLTDERREQLIERWRATRGVSEGELALAMRRQAYLRKLAETRFVVNEKMIRAEFERIYGTKVECRHIELASLRDVDKVRPFVAAGEDFAMLARRHSINDLTAPKGGVLPPFSRGDETIPGVLREAAFRMEPGQVSNPIKVDGSYHLLKVERRIAPEIIQFEDVRASVERALRKRRLPAEMERLLPELLNRAAVRIDDPVLRRQYEQRRGEGRIIGPALRP